MDIAIAFLAGAVIGAFLNSCSYQIPLERPCWHRYQCSACGTRLSLWSTLPLLSWVIQRGRAQCCDARLDVRYLWSELAMGLVFAALWMIYPPPEALAYSIMVAALFLGSLIDLDFRAIPDRCSLGAVVAGLIACGLVPRLMGETSSWLAVRDSLIGAAVSGGVLWLIGFGGGLLMRRKEVMGLGDVKLLAAIGAFLGWHSLYWVLVGGGLTSILVIGGSMLIRRSHDTSFPFGPFLSIGAVSWLLGGGSLTHYFLDHFIHHPSRIFLFPGHGG